jgi:transcription-repair coupling factor (superfamily II helicase)
LPSSPDQEAAAFRGGYIPVTVDLPQPVGIPVDYVPDQEMRLRLYRRLVNLHKEADLETIANEFTDRFGPLPETVQNLFYQLKVKLRAEKAGIASVNLENDQIVLRYPPLTEGSPTKDLADLGREARAGKNGYWVAYTSALENWQERLLDVLDRIFEANPGYALPDPVGVV